MESAHRCSFTQVRLRLQLLCCLGLDGQAVIVALLRELGDLVVSSRSHFLWLDEQFRPYHSCSYPPPGLGNILSRVSGFFHKPGGTVKTIPGIQLSPCMHDASLYVLIPIGKRTLGLLVLDRSAGDPVFTWGERKCLARLAPHIVRALTPCAVLHAPWIDTDEEGLIIAETCGRMRHLTPEAQRLLYLATAPEDIATSCVAMMLPEPILRLCNTPAHQPDEENTASATEAWVHENSLGRFIFRIHRLGPARDFPHLPLMGITVRRQEPLPLKLLRRIDKLPLSFREMQFCLVMASGYCQTAIARHMNISEHTAIAHRRHIYTKLAVHNRAELMSKLLAL